MRCVETIDLASIDQFSNTDYQRLMDGVMQRDSMRGGKKKAALLQAVVSRNRRRYQDDEFNLDLSYITPRVIAMGLPGKGFYSLFRNSQQDVLSYFTKYHDSHIKIYNMCNDDFVDANELALAGGAIRLAYFPFLDHNPGPVNKVFKLALDAVMYLAQDPQNTIAVHCKAGKGRTGLAICAYLLFSQAAENAFKAVQLFNQRRTTNGKGLRIPSQIRYLQYFDHFIKSSFKPPFVQLVAPYAYDPQCFNYLFKPECRLRLMSVCLGPFDPPPDGLKLKVKLRDFHNANFFQKDAAAKDRKGPQWLQTILYNRLKGTFFVLLSFNAEVVVQDDICIMISTEKKAKSKQFPPIKFRYWLGAKYITEKVGKIEQRTSTVENINVNSFMPIEKSLQDWKTMQNPESFYQVVDGQKDPEKSEALKLQPHRQTLGKNYDQMTCRALTDSFQRSIMRYEQNTNQMLRKQDKHRASSMLAGGKLGSLHSTLRVDSVGGANSSMSSEVHHLKGSPRQAGKGAGDIEEPNDENSWPKTEGQPYRTMSFMDSKSGGENQEAAQVADDDFSFLPPAHNNLVLDPAAPGNMILEEQTAEDESSQQYNSTSRGSERRKGKVIGLKVSQVDHSRDLSN